MQSDHNASGPQGPGFAVYDDRTRGFGYTFRHHMDTPEYRSLRGKGPVAVLHLLSTYASGGGGPMANTCYPRQGTIAKVLGLTRETVNRSIKQLETAGFLKRSAAVLTARSGRTTEVVVYSLLTPPSCRPPTVTVKP